MRLLLLLSGLAISTRFAAATPQALGDVFKVDMRPWPQNRGSCNRRRDKDDPNSAPIYDPKASLTDQFRILNKMWSQSIGLAFRGEQALGAQTYNNVFDMRKLAKAFFGIYPDENQSNGTWEPKSGIDLDKLNMVRGRYREMTQFMSTSTPNPLTQPKMFCDQPSMTLMYPNEKMLDTNGNEIVKNPKTRETYTIREYEAVHGRLADQFWFLYVDLGTDPSERAYIVLRKADTPGVKEIINGVEYTFPYPLDPETRQPSMCASGEHGRTFTTPQGFSSFAGTENWWRGQFVLLCPKSFLLAKDDISGGPQPEGTHLDSMDFIALTLLHELFHVLAPFTSPDINPWRPTIGPDGTRVASWPEQKAGFDVKRYDNDGQAFGGVQAMTLQMYDTAAPETMNIDHIFATRNVENYAWFAFVAALSASTKQDWSTGAPRVADSDWAQVTASIPGMKRGATHTPYPNPTNGTDSLLEWLLGLDGKMIL